MDPAARVLAAQRRGVLFPHGARVLVLADGRDASVGLFAFLARHADRLGLADVALAVRLENDEQPDDPSADLGRFARTLGRPFFAFEAPTGSAFAAAKAVGLESGFDRVALADCREDAAARILAQLLGGRTPDQLRPLVSRRADGAVRPFLSLSRAEAAGFAYDAGWAAVPPMVSATALPAEPRARRRAWIETAVLPRLRTEFPGADYALARFGEALLTERRGWSHEARARVRPAGPGVVHIRIERDEPAPLQRACAARAARVLCGDEGNQRSLVRTWLEARLRGDPDDRRDPRAVLVAGAQVYRAARSSGAFLVRAGLPAGPGVRGSSR